MRKLIFTLIISISIGIALTLSQFLIGKYIMDTYKQIFSALVIGSIIGWIGNNLFILIEE